MTQVAACCAEAGTPLPHRGTFYCSKVVIYMGRRERASDSLKALQRATLPAEPLYLHKVGNISNNSKNINDKLNFVKRFIYNSKVIYNKINKTENFLKIL